MFFVDIQAEDQVVAHVPEVDRHSIVVVDTAAETEEALEARDSARHLWTYPSLLTKRS